MTLVRKGVLGAITGCCLLVSGAHAMPIAVANFSFETPDVTEIFPSDTNVSGNTTTVPGWTTSIASGIGFFSVIDLRDIAFTGAEGDNAPLPGTADRGQTAAIVASAPPGGIASLISTLPVAITEANVRYTLTVALGDAKDPFNNPDMVSIELLVNGISIARTTTNGDVLPDDTFSDFSTSFESFVAGQNLSIRLTHENNPITATGAAYFDNVRLQQTAFAVAEPAGRATFGLAAIRRLARKTP